MSLTYEICCNKCKQSLWIGQSERIYFTEKHIEHLAIFLHAHEGHPLVFCESQSAVATECEELSEEMDEATAKVIGLSKPPP